MVNSVVLFVIDGLRPDGLQQADAPHIDTFVSSGACTYAARAVMPSSTLPCHVSMCRGVPPERHGITTNTWVPPGLAIRTRVDLIDNPPTIAALLGIEPAPEWTGKVVDEVVQG